MSDSGNGAKLPAPEDDGACDHLLGLHLPAIALGATSGSAINLAKLKGLTVVFIYPITGRPDRVQPDNWDLIPGAKGCTPQACAFRDSHADLIAAGADQVFGLSVQDTDYQREASERLHLPYPLLSDETLAFAKALNLPLMNIEGMELTKRVSLIIRDGVIIKTFYPVFPTDRSASEVLEWLHRN